MGSEGHQNEFDAKRKKRGLKKRHQSPQRVRGTSALDRVLPFFPHKTLRFQPCFLVPGDSTRLGGDEKKRKAAEAQETQRDVFFDHGFAGCARGWLCSVMRAGGKNNRTLPVAL